MSETSSQESPAAIPPISPPTSGVTPPPQFAAYARPGTPMGVAGSPDKLENLAAGYFGLSGVFLFHILYLFGGMMVAAMLSSNGNADTGTAIWLVCVLSTLVIIPVIAYRPIKRIGLALGWSPVLNVVFAIALLFFGIIGYIVLQTIASSEIKKYGVKRRFFGGYKKKEIAEMVAAMRASPYYQAQAAPFGQTTF